MVSLVWLPSKAWSATLLITFCNCLFQLSIVAICLVSGLNPGWKLSQHKQDLQEVCTSMRELNWSQAVLWH